MPNHDIIILKGNTANGKLKLDRDEINVYVGDTVTWSISASSNVVSFRIKKKWLYSRIFTEDDPTDHGRELNRQVKKDVPGRKFKYSIYWKDSDGNIHEYDPKISVMPSPFNFPKLLIGLILSILALFSLKSFLGKGSRK